MPRSRPPLASVQAALLARITGLKLGAPANDVAALVRGDRRAAQRRLDVYASMYRSRLVEALESQFPRLARALGGDDFVALVARYIGDAPSRHPSLREIGRAFPRWLAAKHPDRPARAALAALEWARLDLHDQADEPVLTLEAVREVPPEKFAALPLRLIAAHRLVEVDGETEAAWDALDPGVEEPPLELEGTVAGAATLLVWRQGIAVYHRAPELEERAALKLAAVGVPFGVICEQLGAARTDGTADGAAAARAFGWLSMWLADGLLAAI
ncbi:MAG TPA: DNA-binding domain-containing protein [Polyangia bacterium]